MGEMGEMGEGVYTELRSAFSMVASFAMVLIVIGGDTCRGVLWDRDGEDGAAESEEEEGYEAHC